MFKVKNLIILIHIFFILLAIELFFNFILDYRNIVKKSTCERIYNNKKDFSFYSPNCEIIVKHWEQKNFVSYRINSHGRRDLSIKNLNLKKIAFVGDSFTFGAMVPIEDNYNYYAFNDILENSFDIHNYGTPSEQLHNVFNKIKNINHKNYDYFVYGLTPNDFFNLVDGSYKNSLKNNNNDKKTLEVKKNKMELFKKIKNYLISTATSRFISHKLMSNDKIYLQTYLLRAPYSGYLSQNLPSGWNNAINYFDKFLIDLKPNYKSKLKIFIIPQRAEVVSTRLNTYNFTFVNKIINVCKKNKIDCFAPNLNPLSNIKESHFPVDGHLTILGNHVLAKELSKWASNWN